MNERSFMETAAESAKQAASMLFRINAKAAGFWMEGGDPETGEPKFIGLVIVVSDFDLQMEIIELLKSKAGVDVEQSGLPGLPH